MDMDSENEKICALALGRVFGEKPRIALALIECFGSAQAVFEAGDRQLEEVLGPGSRYRGLLSARALEEARSESQSLEKMGARYLPCTDAAYPGALRDSEDPPVGLYYRGCSPAEEIFAPERPCVSIVGTRDASPYGLKQCEALVQALSTLQPAPVIVSGLAYGIDICAHRTALHCGLPTLAVMATGIDRIYPWQHRMDAEAMANTPGCALLTDYPLDTPAVALNFVRRNRIIAALSRWTVLVESREKGGGMITARLAFGYGREVYALPGRLDDLRSQGCNRLIATKVAEAYTSPEELLEAMGLRQPTPGRRSGPAPAVGGRPGVAGGLGLADESGGGAVGCGPGSMEEASRKTARRFYAEKMSPDDLEAVTKMLIRIRADCGVTLMQLAEDLHLSEYKVGALSSLLEADGLINVDLLKRCRIGSD